MAVAPPLTQSAEDRRGHPPAVRWRWLRRLAPLIVLFALGALAVAMGWHRELSLEALLSHRAALESYVAASRPAAIAAFIAIYVVVVALSIPGALYLTVSGGLLFGIVTGALASVIGATIGAAIVFLIARTAFGPYLARRGGPMVERLAEGFRENAFSYLLLLRLVPLFPFFLVNLVPALAGVRLLPFVAATVIGIVPAGLAFALVGASIDSVLAAEAASYRACLAAGRSDCHLHFDPSVACTPQLIAALVALALVALVPLIVKRVRARRAAAG